MPALYPKTPLWFKGVRLPWVHGMWSCSSYGVFVRWYTGAAVKVLQGSCNPGCTWLAPGLLLAWFWLGSGLVRPVLSLYPPPSGEGRFPLKGVIFGEVGYFLVLAPSGALKGALRRFRGVFERESRGGIEAGEMEGLSFRAGLAPRIRSSPG